MSTITLTGKAKIEEEIQDLTEQLRQVRQEKAIAYDQTGDAWHDNPYFKKLEQNERVLTARIAELQELLSTAQIITTESRNMERVEIGSIIKCECTYLDFNETEIMILEIVGHGETDIDSGKINYESVVAQNLLGLHKNEVAAFDTPGGKVQYKILDFYVDWDSAKNSPEL